MKMKNKSEPYYKTISEVAKLLNLVNKKNGSLSTHTLRFWEKKFNQIKPKILAGNRRYYDSKSIEIIKKIKFLLKDRGMTIQGANKYLNNENSFKLDHYDNRIINSKKILKSKLKKISKLAKELKKK
tara:strand:+ start:262 stop:642 length:381 start_codon:yes stop_codon:yes gene_type:complete